MLLQHATFVMPGSDTSSVGLLLPPAVTQLVSVEFAYQAFNPTECENVNKLSSQAVSQRVLTFRPATLAGGKVSLRARVNAFSMTRLQVASGRCGARLPSKMVVLALIGGSSSTYNNNS